MAARTHFLSCILDQQSLRNLNFCKSARWARLALFQVKKKPPLSKQHFWKVHENRYFFIQLVFSYNLYIESYLTLKFHQNLIFWLFSAKNSQNPKLSKKKQNLIKFQSHITFYLEVLRQHQLYEKVSIFMNFPKMLLT